MIVCVNVKTSTVILTHVLIDYLQILPLIFFFVKSIITDITDLIGNCFVDL